MDKIYKVFWVLRAVFFKAFFGSFGSAGYLGRPVFLLGSRRMRFGRKVRIFPGLRAECFSGGALSIGDDVSIGQNFHVICSSKVTIGSGCLISSNVFVTDTDHQFTDISTSVMYQPNVLRDTWIGENCFLGTGVCIQAGTVLGKGCVVGANAVVRGEFPDHCVIVGVPARVIRKYDPDAGEWRREALMKV